MNVTMLGVDYAYANEALGADWGKVFDWVGKVIGTGADVAMQYLETEKVKATSQADSNAIDKALALIRQTGSTQAALDEAKRQSGFDWQANTPWLIIGGVGLVAILFLVGTRRRR